MKDVNILTNNGVNVAQSLELFGDMEMYDETLKDFLDMVEGKLQSLENRKSMSDMVNYAIEVHALKSDARYLGFTTLADLSYESELKSKAGDIMFVQENHPKIIAEARRMIDVSKQYLGLAPVQPVQPAQPAAAPAPEQQAVPAQQPVPSQPMPEAQPMPTAPVAEPVAAPVAEMPQAPVMPAAPVMPEVPVQPAVPAAPVAPAVPEVPAAPMPEVQAAPAPVAPAPVPEAQPMPANPMEQALLDQQAPAAPAPVAAPVAPVEVAQPVPAMPAAPVMPEVPVQPAPAPVAPAPVPEAQPMPSAPVAPAMPAAPAPEPQVQFFPADNPAPQVQFFPAGNPAQPMQQPMMQPGYPAAQGQAPAGQKEGTILIVDDSNLVVNFVKKIFDAKYNVIIANDGAKAIELVDQEEVRKDIKACLLDLNMPNVDGYAVLEHFKQKGYFVRMPVAVESGVEDMASIDRVNAYPIVDILTKPFNERDVQRVIEKCLATYF